MVWDKLDNNIAYRGTVPLEQEPKKTQDIPPETVPMVKENPENNDLDKPIEGYHIETEETVKKPDENPDNNDNDMSTSVDPEARVSVAQTIAISKNTDGATSAMEQTVNRVVVGLSSSDNSFYKAQTMLSDSHPYKCFDEINFAKSFYIYGKTVFEGNYLNFTNNEPHSEQTLSRNSERADLGLNWRSKSGNTKAFAFGSFTHTDSKLKIESLESDTESNEGPLVIEGNTAYNSYSFYGAAQHKFKNGDKFTGSGFHIKDSTQEISTTSFDVSYFLRKYMVLAEGNTTIYKVGNLDPVTKTNFSISLNPELLELASEPKKEENNNTENKANTEENASETNVKKNVSNTQTKKCSFDTSLFFETQSISSLSANTEEGFGVKLRMNRLDEDSKLKFTTFGKLSTTQQEKSNTYHATFGSGLKFLKNYGDKSLLTAETEIKYRHTFGQETTFTASANAMFTSPKFSAEAEAKGILISGDRPSYFGFVLRPYYTPNKNLNFFTEFSYTYLKEQNIKMEGTNIQAGVIVNF